MVKASSQRAVEELQVTIPGRFRLVSVKLVLARLGSVPEASK